MQSTPRSDASVHTETTKESVPPETNKKSVGLQTNEEAIPVAAQSTTSNLSPGAGPTASPVKDKSPEAALERQRSPEKCPEKEKSPEAVLAGDPVREKNAGATRERETTPGPKEGSAETAGNSRPSPGNAGVIPGKEINLGAALEREGTEKFTYVPLPMIIEKACKYTIKYSLKKKFVTS